ncbi:MAG: hypothetical protein AAF569_06635 [Pseudomonadota bacterium]
MNIVDLLRIAVTSWANFEPEGTSEEAVSQLYSLVRLNEKEDLQAQQEQRLASIRRILEIVARGIHIGAGYNTGKVIEFMQGFMPALTSTIRAKGVAQYDREAREFFLDTLIATTKHEPKQHPNPQHRRITVQTYMDCLLAQEGYDHEKFSVIVDCMDDWMYDYPDCNSGINPFGRISVYSGRDPAAADMLAKKLEAIEASELGSTKNTPISFLKSIEEGFILTASDKPIVLSLIAIANNNYDNITDRLNRGRYPIEVVERLVDLLGKSSDSTEPHRLMEDKHVSEALGEVVLKAVPESAISYNFDFRTYDLGSFRASDLLGKYLKLSNVPSDTPVLTRYFAGSSFPVGGHDRHIWFIPTISKDIETILPRIDRVSSPEQLSAMGYAYVKAGRHADIMKEELQSEDYGSEESLKRIAARIKAVDGTKYRLFL